MRRRGAFMYGNALPRSPTGQIGTGLGMGSSVGTTSLIPPNLLIQTTGEDRLSDGARDRSTSGNQFSLPGFPGLLHPWGRDKLHA